MTTPLVRATDIAKIAGVSRAAVTQWRKKYDDFPAPQEGAETSSPLYRRDDIERWLRAHGRNAATVTGTDLQAVVVDLTDHLRAQFTVEDHPDVAGALVTAECLARTCARGPVRSGPAVGLDHPVRLEDGTIVPTLAEAPNKVIESWLRDLMGANRFLDAALKPLEWFLPETGSADDGRRLSRYSLGSLIGVIAPVPDDELAQVYDAFLEKIPRSVASFMDPPAVAELLVDLAGISNGVLFDPAAGAASTLLEAGARHPHLELVGVEADASVAAVAIRRAILRGRDLDLRIANSLSFPDPTPDVLADAVVVDPPFGHRDFGPGFDPSDPRWVFGRPVLGASGIWLQHAISHLADQGRAFVITSVSDLVRRGQGREALRHALLRQGAVEAVIELPPHAFAHTSIPTAVWVLTRPGHAVDPDRVLLLQAPSAEGVASSRFTAVVDTYRQWRTRAAIDEADHAVIVPVRDLLAPGAGLSPVIWLARDAAPTPQQLLDEIYRAHDAAYGAGSTPAVSFTPLTGAVRREKLAALDGVQILRGSRVVISRSGRRAAQHQQVLSSTVLRELEQGRAPSENSVGVPLGEVSVLTEKGDIYVTTSGVLSARIIDIEGWAIPAVAHLVRVDDTKVDRWFLAACIDAATRLPWVSHGSVAPQLNLQRVEIPVLPLSEQRRIGDVVRRIDAERVALERKLHATRRLLKAVDDAVSAGAVTVQAEPASEPATVTRTRRRPVSKPRARAKPAGRTSTPPTQ
ncbi:N-6 DNA methylase [Rhodococcus ruber]